MGEGGYALSEWTPDCGADVTMKDICCSGDAAKQPD
jgi:hypothetical protein